MAQRIQLPDGNVAEFPDGMQSQEIEAVLQKQFPPQQAQQQKPGAVADAVHNAPGALARGFAAIAGLPGDAATLGAKAGDWIHDAIQSHTGIDTHVAQEPFHLGTPPTSGDINSAISKPFGGYYKPETNLGKYTGAALEFAPAAIGGGGGVVAHAARAIVPGVASEAAGQMTEGTKYEPYARAAGALVGGVGTGMVQSALKAPVMSMGELKAAKDAAYTAANQAGVVIRPQSFQTFASDLTHDLTTNNVVQSKLHENAIAALDAIQQEAAAGAPISLEKADAIRQVVNNAIEAAGKNNGGDLRLAGKIKTALDGYLDGLTPADTISGNAAVAVPILKEARGLAQREFKAKEIQKLMDLAENQASANYSSAGVETALRQQFKSFNAKLIKDPQLAKTFTAEERAAIEQVSQGGPVGNVLRYFGKLAPRGVISGGAGAAAGATIGSALGGPVGAGVGSFAVPAFGELAKRGATMATTRNAQLAQELMRAGPSGAAALQNPTNSASMIANLLLSQAKP